MKFAPIERWGSRHLRKAAIAAAAAFAAFSVIATTAAAAPLTATDYFFGAAVIPAGQTSPVQVDTTNMTVRADGAIGIGYTYQANGVASGTLAGSFTYAERGYLYFRDPTDPTSMVGSQYVSGVFTLNPRNGGAPVRIADSAPQNYTSGITTLDEQLAAHIRRQLRGFAPKSGPLTYGYFTFTDPHGTFTGYATPDFTRFMIRITFNLP